MVVATGTEAGATGVKGIVGQRAGAGRFQAALVGVEKFFLALAQGFVRWHQRVEAGLGEAFAGGLGVGEVGDANGLGIGEQIEHFGYGRIGEATGAEALELRRGVAVGAAHGVEHVAHGIAAGFEGRIAGLAQGYAGIFQRLIGGELLEGGYFGLKAVEVGGRDAFGLQIR